MALESLAIALGTNTFAEEIRGKKVVVYNDNKAAEASEHKEMVCAQRYLCVNVCSGRNKKGLSQMLGSLSAST